MRTYLPPLPDDLPAHVRVVLELTAPAYATDMIELVGSDDVRSHLEAWLDPEFEVEVVFAAPRGDLRGPDALLDAWGELLSVFSSYRPHLDEVVDVGGGRVALFGHDDIATHEGIRLTVPVGAIYEVEGGRVRRARFFPDQTAARAELG